MRQQLGTLLQSGRLSGALDRTYLEARMESARSVALITGASSGIGAALSKRFAHDGRDLVIVARRRERLESLARRLHDETGVTVEVMAADLTEPSQLQQVMDRVHDDERIDMLVNNAGFGGYGLFAELEADFADRLLGVHVRAPMRLTRAALPGMVRRGHGAIVNVASLLALSGPLKVPMSGRATYVGAKAFLLSFTQALALEVKGTGVKAMVVLPGMVETEFFSTRRGGGPPDVPSLMSAHDVAQAIVVGLELDEVICVPGLEDMTLFDALRDIQKATLFGGTAAQLATRYRR
jgi:short-subunit dehydrogenase